MTASLRGGRMAKKNPDHLAMKVTPLLSFPAGEEYRCDRVQVCDVGAVQCTAVGYTAFGGIPPVTHVMSVAPRELSP